MSSSKAIVGALVGLTLTIQLLAGVVSAQVFPDGPFYISNEEEVPLIASERYAAFFVKPSELPDFEEEVALTGMLTVETSDLTDKYEIVLVRRDDTAGDGGFGDAVEGLRDGRDWFPAFQSGQTDKLLLNEFIVRFDSSVSDDDAEDVFESIGATDLGTGKPSRNKYLLSFPEMTVFQALEVVNNLARDDNVIYATPNFLRISRRKQEARRSSLPPEDSPLANIAYYPLTAATWPNDQYYPNQWALRKVNADAAWKSTTGGCNAKIAIVDGGVDLDHEDLKIKITGKKDLIDDDHDPEPFDPDDVHGTESAGAAAARTNNAGVGVAGMAWGGEIIVIRIFDGTPTSLLTTDNVISEGIDAAVAKGATVISNGWGYAFADDRENPEVVKEAIEDAIAENRVLVFAVGNKGICSAGVICSSDVEWPANLSDDMMIIAVGATDATDTLLPASKFTAGDDEVTLVAPGAFIYSTHVTGSDEGKYTNYFEETSAATPLVAGAAALLLSWSPSASPQDIRDWLVQGVIPPAAGTVNPEAYGAGRMDVALSLTKVGNIGIALDSSLDSDNRLSHGEETMIRATVTRDTEPLSGAMVKFKSRDPSLAAVAPSIVYLPANCDGVVSARVRGETNSPFFITTYIDVEVDGITQSVPVKVGGIGWVGVLGILAMLAIAAVAAIGVAMRKPPPMSDSGSGEAS